MQKDPIKHRSLPGVVRLTADSRDFRIENRNITNRTRGILHKKESVLQEDRNYRTCTRTNSRASEPENGMAGLEGEAQTSPLRAGGWITGAWSDSSRLLAAPVALISQHASHRGPAVWLGDAHAPQ